MEDVKKNSAENGASAPRKPIALLRNELIEKINNDIAEIQQAGLPLDIVHYVMRDFTNEIDNIIKREEQRQIQEYNQALQDYANANATNIALKGDE